MHRVWLVFFSLAVAFITIGLTSQRTFLYVGLGFLFVAIYRLARRS